MSSDAPPDSEREILEMIAHEMAAAKEEGIRIGLGVKAAAKITELNEQLQVEKLVTLGLRTALRRYTPNAAHIISLARAEAERSWRDR